MTLALILLTPVVAALMLVLLALVAGYWRSEENKKMAAWREAHDHWRRSR